ncbi:T9SS type B sorting domain-containing protein [Hymenobacter terricola]|uniref:T9SS type B sorting domain-containing protein n=1 Tax=Hymenobacter terricola TaxID=2819236 RepID=UPI001B31694D|nr:gliding motility-associated C-terminal domain-containing protein [Hymenobacter terricola]
MIQVSLLRVGALGRVALLLVVVAMGLGLRPDAAWATHIRAGDIQAKVDTTAAHNPRRVFFKLTLYTDNAHPVPEEVETVFFGDGTSSCLGGIPRDGAPKPIPGNTDTSLNIYYFDHIYPSAGTFTVQFIGENRVAGVQNMDNSVNLSFYISTTFKLDPALGLNHSPVLRAPAIDKAGLNQVFLHNPAAFDADGDSLVFKLQPCQYNPVLAQYVVGPPCVPGPGTNTPTPAVCTNYRLPNDPSVTPASVPPIQVGYGGVPPGVPGAPAIFQIDVNTGQITWNAPVAVGPYNVAFRVEEWRRTPLGRSKIGEVVRDMQIVVSATNNLPPTITIPPDICVIAGQTVTGTVTATDGVGPGSTAQTPISLFAYSGILPPATFTQSLTGPPQARGTFTWQTQCNNVAQLPYLVVFKAQDTPNPPTPTNPVLIDEKTWRITVVGPAPQGLRTAPTTSGGINSAVLNWNTYTCANASRIYIYRKVNPSSFVPGPCDTGIPASAGYTRIGSVAANVTTFTDSNVSASGTAQGLDRGQTYCYRIYAEFPLPAGGASIASQEACVSFTGSAARIVKVDVENTGVANGQVQVCWTQPRAAAGTVLDGTPSYVLSRGEGLTPTAFAPIATLTSLLDTCYTDTNVNTQDLQFTYKLEFVRTFPPAANLPAVREASPTASSVRVNAIPANAAASAVTVSWTYNVPWDNTAHPAVIFRRTGGTGPFTRLGTAPTTATGGNYADSDPGLVKGQTYCYYVQTEGQYAGIPYLSSLLNRSQQRCLVLTSPPCIPVLALQTTNCDSLAALQEFPGLDQRYANHLRWKVGNLPAGCDATIASYRVYYRPAPTGPFTLLGTTTQTSYVHTDLAFSGGCYAVQAVAPSGAVSDTSNVACQDNCVFFKLPNIFTPNGDGQNAVFRPRNNSPVRSIHFKAFNRWGVKVFENTTTANDPVLINWDGGGPTGEANSIGAKVVDGIYYYLAEVEFADFANTRRTYKGWVEIVR